MQRAVYTVVFNRAAEDDLLRLYDFAMKRELSSAMSDLSILQRAIEAIRNGCTFLACGPFSCPKAQPRDNSFVREPLISFCAPGYVALFEIRNTNTVIIGVLRHQRKDDYT